MVPCDGSPTRTRIDQSVPGLGPASSPEADLTARQADFLGDLGIAQALEGQEDEGSPLPELRRRRGGVANGAQDFLLPFGDGNLGCLTRHGERPPGEWEASKAG